MLSKFKQSKELTLEQQLYYDEIKQLLIDKGIEYVRRNIYPTNREIYNLAISDTMYMLTHVYTYNNVLKNQKILL